jgi:hypothetical protein
MSPDMGTKSPLMVYRAVQATWALALLGFVAPMIIARGLAGHNFLYLSAFVLFGVASIGIFTDCRWAWVVSIAFLAAYWVLRGWAAWVNFVVNSYMFLSGHELYRDSPATILVVATYAVFGILPATCLLILAVISRRRLIAILTGRHSIDSVETAE